jgi:hypothetical protein
MQKTILAVFSFLTLAGTAFGAGTTQNYGFSRCARDPYYIWPRWSCRTLSTDDVLNGVDNGFAIRRSRIYLTSNVTPNVKGRVQFEMKPDKVEALDVYFDLSTSMQGKMPLTFRLGQYKKPFSYQEYVMTSNNLNLIDRPYTNAFLEKKLLASARDQGIMAIGDLWEYDIPVMVQFGVFNGNGMGQKLDSNSESSSWDSGSHPLTGISLGGASKRIRWEPTTLETYTVWGGKPS